MGDLIGNSKAAAAKGRLKKGKKHKLTKLKEAIGIDRTNQIVAQIEKNIEEFINHKNEKIKLDATKAFTDYYKPRKKESNINLKGEIKFIVNKNLVDSDND